LDVELSERVAIERDPSELLSLICEIENGGDAKDVKPSAIEVAKPTPTLEVEKGLDLEITQKGFGDTQVLPETSRLENDFAKALIDSFRRLIRRENNQDFHCPYKSKWSKNSRVIIIDCGGCDFGNSTLGDPRCRMNIFKMLSREPFIGRMVLSNLYERDYEGENLDFLYLLTNFMENVNSYRSVEVLAKCEACKLRWKRWMDSLVRECSEDPLTAYLNLRRLIQHVEGETLNEAKCNACKADFKSMLIGMIQAVPELGKKILDHGNIEYDNMIKPLVRPRFSTSRIYTIPPSNTEFLEGYDVARKGGRDMEISIYRLTDRPENLYFVLPIEYRMSPKELELIEAVRSRLIRLKPSDLNFADPPTSREYFRRLGMQIFSEEAARMGFRIMPEDLKIYSDLLAKYTTGLGILEDVLSDERVTDVYVNAPADLNPLHVVVDGEECLSNIYLSQDDLDSLISRFRAISGRPFGEAKPVLDLDLPEFKTRVSAIGNPLSAGGLAYAFRKHARSPWTLPKLINAGALTPLGAGLISFLVDSQSSVLIAGGVGAGKTSLLAAMLLEIPQRYRILTIEDTPELPLETLQRLGWKIQGMHTRSPVMASDAEIRPETALRAALRLGNSALVLGEVRGPEVKVLYEAMQVGTAGNSVLGTIHGASTRAVYERIVNNLGVPAAAFRATDAIIVCQNIRISGTLRKKKRVVQISEVTDREWGDSPDADEVFCDIMTFDASQDMILPTDLLDKGQSELVGKIAHKWGITVDDAILNIKMRAMIKEAIARAGLRDGRLVEADMVSKANNMFWLYLDDMHGRVDFQEVYERWNEWYTAFIGKDNVGKPEPVLEGM